MVTCQQEMENGIKSFLEKQKVNPETKATLAQFDTEYELVYPPLSVADVPTYHLMPRYGTALNDAVARFVRDVGADLAAKPEHERPGKVIVVIVTDGHENSSREFPGEPGRQKVADMITHQKSHYGWEFVFLGANMDAVQVAAGFGIARGQSMTFNTRNSGVVMDSLSSNVVAYAAAAPGAAYSWSEEDREKATK